MLNPHENFYFPLLFRNHTSGFARVMPNNYKVCELDIYFSQLFHKAQHKFQISSQLDVSAILESIPSNLKLIRNKNCVVLIFH